MTVTRRQTNPKTAEVDFGAVQVNVALDAGPRILGYARCEGPQLFADLPGEVIGSAIGDFAFLGGHRLWRAPEIPSITYEPDDRPVEIDRTGNGVRLAGPPGVEGITRIIELSQREDMTVVDHTLRNDGSGAVRCAAWSITQLVPGGTAVLPQPLDPVDAAGVLPNRAIVLWPYTDPGAPEVELGRTEVRVHASGTKTRSKVGQANRRGWLAYVLGGEVFVKWAPLHDDSREHPDLGASVQCYRDHRFLELESLGPLAEVAPGSELHHREVWTLLDLRGRPLAEVLASLPAQPKEMSE